jgi:3-deoxy-D-manno-octulosonic-acid transferase
MNQNRARTDMPRLLYSALVMLIAPAAFAVVLLRGFRDRSYWSALSERFGYGRHVRSPSIWLHAVSLGEVSAAAAVVRALRARYPGVPFVLSTATPTGRHRALSLFANEVDVRFLPYDTPGSVRRFLTRIQPRVAIIMETELWPNLLDACRRRHVPVVFASARLTAKSVSRYRRIAPLIRETLANATVAAQSAEDAERFIAIGADRRLTHVIGNVKFDMQLDASILEQGRAFKLAVLGARSFWVAGSTHEGEEEQMLAAQDELRSANAVLVLVPRHPQRFDSVADMLERREVRFDRRSTGKPLRPEADVLLADTVGELPALYAAADAAFVGGSLVPVGGHNLLEPAALGVPVITGPHTANSKDIARLLVERRGAAVVKDSKELADALRRLLADPAARERMGSAAREFVETQRGSVARLVALIEPLMALQSHRTESPPAAANP